MLALLLWAPDTPEGFFPPESTVSFKELSVHTYSVGRLILIGTPWLMNCFFSHGTRSCLNSLVDLDLGVLAQCSSVLVYPGLDVVQFCLCISYTIGHV